MRLKPQYLDSIEDMRKSLRWGILMVGLILSPWWCLWFCALFVGNASAFGLFLGLIFCLYLTAQLSTGLWVKYYDIKKWEEREKEIAKNKKNIPPQGLSSPPTPSAISPNNQTRQVTVPPNGVSAARAETKHPRPTRKTVLHVTCSRCGKPMVIRTNRYTKMA